MTCEYTFTYLTCQSCNAKIHCDECADSLRERIMRESGINSAEIDMPNHHMKIVLNGMDEDDLEDILEDAGLFID